jgi:hypothetical protein
MRLFTNQQHHCIIAVKIRNNYLFNAFFFRNIIKGLCRQYKKSGIYAWRILAKVPISNIKWLITELVILMYYSHINLIS